MGADLSVLRYPQTGYIVPFVWPLLLIITCMWFYHFSLLKNITTCLWGNLDKCGGNTGSSLRQGLVPPWSLSTLHLHHCVDQHKGPKKNVFCSFLSRWYNINNSAISYLSISFSLRNPQQEPNIRWQSLRLVLFHVLRLERWLMLFPRRSGIPTQWEANQVPLK